MFGNDNMNGKLMAIIGSGVGLGFSWGELLQSAAGALVGAVVAITINETWKYLKRRMGWGKLDSEKKDN